MPRVGSSIISSARLGGQPLGQHDLLLVAAGQLFHRFVQAGVLQAQALAPTRGRASRSPRGSEQPEAPQPVQHDQRHCCARSRRVHDAGPAGGGPPAPVPPRRASAACGSRGGSGSPLSRDRARVVAVDAEDRPDHLAAPGRRPARPARRSRPRGPRRDVVEDAGAGQPRDVEDDLADRRRRPSGTGRSSSRPTIQRTTCSAVVSAADRLGDDVAPSRITVTRSQSAKTSSRRWEMNTTAAPPSRRRAGHVEQPRRPRLADSAAVGSSITITRASSDSALAISTICWSAMDRPRARAVGIERDAELG